MMNFIQIIGLIILSTLFQYHQVLFYNIMNQTKSVNVYGNIICAAVGFLIVFLTSIFVAKNFYDSKINGLIEEVTVLKDYHYSYWGQSPGAIPSEYTYTLTPYSIDTSQLPSSINSKPLEPILFNYSYKYKQVSFGQGNQGFIRYKDSWKLTPSKNIENSNITTINLGAQKVYGYQYYSTISRRFTIMFNNLLSNAKKILIPFYSMTLHQFYISNQKNVYNNIFKESGLDQDKMNLIYNHELYGWKTPKTFQTWVKLCNRLDRSSLQEYQTLIEVFGLSVSQLQRLIGQKSFLKVLTKALNGTIKAKIQDPNGANYIKCKPFCNDEQLLTLQFSQGLLTTDFIFSSINIGKATNEIITIIPNEIELKSFCTRQGKSCVQDGNAFDFFASQFFSDYSVVNQVFTNKENLKMIEAILDVLDPTGEYLYAQSMVQYMDYLYNNVFTPTSDDTSQPDFKAYNYMFNNYLYFNQTINNFKEILFIQLHARALKNVIDQDPQTFACQNFYKGSYSKFLSVCQNSLFDLKTLDSIKNYIKAYFFQQRSWFIEKTKMSYEQASKFFKLDKINSLFASQIDKIRTILGVSFGCQNIYCNEEQLIAKQWSGSNQILTKLPKQLFSKSSVSILQWDVNNKFKGIQPQYYKIMKQTIQQQKAKQLLSLQIDATQSILHPFVLFSYKIKAQSGDAQAKKILNYIQKLVIDSYFKGPFVSKSLNQTIVGYKPEGIAQKRDMDIQNGGAPWIENIVSLVEIQYNGDRFNKLNTGIYERQKLRSMLEYNQKAQIGTYYTIYESQQTKVEQFIGSQDKIHGTNILGFHSDIGSQEVLSCYLNFADQTIILNPIVTQYQYNGIIAIKYNVKNLEKSSNIGFSHQNERFAIIDPQSFFIVDPITGTTLSFSIKFSVSTKMTYLQYYFPNPISQIKLYDMEVQYNRKDFQDILNIMDEKQNLFMFYIITMSLSVASMICIIVGTIMYRRKLKIKKSILKDTLISDDDKSSIKI